MSAARSCGNCSGPLPPDSAKQRRFCEDRWCKRERKRENESLRRKRNLKAPWPKRRYEPGKYGPERWDDLPPWNVPSLRVNGYMAGYGGGGPKLPLDLLAVRDDFEARRGALMDLLHEQALLEDDADELELAA
jgi:hypothetical protein